MSQFIIPQDPQLVGLPVLLNGDAIKTHLSAQLNGAKQSILDCDVTYVRHRAGETCLAAHEVTWLNEASGKPEKLLWYGKCFTEQDFAAACARVAAKPWVKPRVGQALTLISEHRILLFAYPNDLRLCGLSGLEQESTQARVLSELGERWPHLRDRAWSMNIVKYKPANRAVFCWQSCAPHQSGCKPADASMYLKVYPKKHGRAIHARMSRLAHWLGSRSDMAIPQPLGLFLGGALLVISSLRGTKVKHMGVDDGRAAIKRIANALAVLHTYEDPDSPRRTNADYLSQAEQSIQALVRHMPALSRQCEAISRAFQEGAPANRESTLGFVHGEFRAGNVLVDSETVGLFDLDRVHTGPIESGIGRFLAHFPDDYPAADESLADDFLAAYSKANGRTLTRSVIGWWTAIALLHIAARPIRRIDAEAPAKTTRLLTSVERALRCR